MKSIHHLAVIFQISAISHILLPGCLASDGAGTQIDRYPSKLGAPMPRSARLSSGQQSSQSDDTSAFHTETRFRTRGNNHQQHYHHHSASSNSGPNFHGAMGTSGSAGTASGGGSSGGGSWTLAKPGTIRLVRLDAPSQVVAGVPIRLRCLYEVRGDRLQSLSWSRNGREFYRYQPFERRQQQLFFNSTGLYPDISRSRNNTVLLTNTTMDTSGRYSCEVTGSQFQEVKLETYINVTSASNGSYSNNYSSSSPMMFEYLIAFVAMMHQLAHRLQDKNPTLRV